MEHGETDPFGQRQQELRMANEELLFDALGVRPGSVTPLALVNDRAAHRVTLVLDQALHDDAAGVSLPIYFQFQRLIRFF